MRSLCLTAVLSAWLCLSGISGRGVDAQPPPETGTRTHQHNSFTGMDGLITTVLDEYKDLQPGAQQGIARRLKEALALTYQSHHFATATYNFNRAIEAVHLLYPGKEGANAQNGAITGPEGCDKAGVDPPWDACREGGSLLRLFAGSRAVDAQGQPTLEHTAVVFWWPVEEVTHVQGTIAEAIYDFDQTLKTQWWWHNLRKQQDTHLWRVCAGGRTIPVDVTVIALCFTTAYAKYANTKDLPRLRGFIVAPGHAEYDFSLGHIFMFEKDIRPKLPKEQLSIDYGGHTQVGLLLAALL